MAHDKREFSRDFDEFTHFSWFDPAQMGFANGSKTATVQA
jgi:hypothetical protein